LDDQEKREKEKCDAFSVILLQLSVLFWRTAKINPIQIRTRTNSRRIPAKRCPSGGSASANRLRDDKSANNLSPIRTHAEMGRTRRTADATPRIFENCLQPLGSLGNLAKAFFSPQEFFSDSTKFPPLAADN
jgi:hypothetical protein